MSRSEKAGREEAVHRVVSLALGEFSDSVLIDRCIDGDQQAFGELYRRYHRPVRDLCRRLVNDAARVDDLAQETFLRALSHIEQFRPGDRLWPWLSTIARNVCIDELRSRRTSRMASIDEDDFAMDAHIPQDTESPADLVVRRETRAGIRRDLSAAFSHLTPHDRMILWLHSVEEWEYQDIATLNGSTVHAVRNVAFRARRRLRVYLEQHGRTPAFIPAFVALLRRRINRAKTRAGAVVARLSGASQLEGFAHLGVAFAVVSIILISGPPSAPQGTAVPTKRATTRYDTRIVSPESQGSTQVASGGFAGIGSFTTIRVLPPDDLPVTIKPYAQREREGALLPEQFGRRIGTEEDNEYGLPYISVPFGWACAESESETLKQLSLPNPFKPGETITAIC